MNRKYIIGCICISLCASLSAGRKLNSVDGFSDVEIMEISWRGIHITHQSGACILTPEKLSEKGKLLLKDELEEAQQLQKKRVEEAQKLQKKRVEEQTRNVELAIQNSKLADAPKLSLEILQEAEDKFSQATNRNQLQKEIKQKQEELVEYQKVKFAEALAFREQKKYKNAFEIFQEIAHEGHPEAQNYLAMMYRDGQGVKKDESVAFDWFQRSALQGHAGAQNNLAVMYFHGLGISKDEEKAFNWFLKSAKQGLAESELCLAVMYAKGCGVNKDFVQAIKWGTMAAEQNHEEAQLFLGEIYCLEEGGKNYVEAIKWYRKAAEQGNHNAMTAIGHCYQNGVGVTQDKAVAEQWYQKAEQWYQKNDPQGYKETKRAKKIALRKAKLENLIPRGGSTQERNVADTIIKQIGSGMSVRGVFSQSGIKEYAKHSNFIYQLLVRLIEHERCPYTAEFLLLPSGELNRIEMRRSIEGLRRRR